MCFGKHATLAILSLQSGLRLPHQHSTSTFTIAITILLHELNVRLLVSCLRQETDIEMEFLNKISNLGIRKLPRVARNSTREFYSPEQGVVTNRISLIISSNDH